MSEESSEWSYSHIRPALLLQSLFFASPELPIKTNSFPNPPLFFVNSNPTQLSKTFLLHTTIENFLPGRLIGSVPISLPRVQSSKHQTTLPLDPAHWICGHDYKKGSKSDTATALVIEESPKTSRKTNNKTIMKGPWNRWWMNEKLRLYRNLIQNFKHLKYSLKQWSVKFPKVTCRWQYEGKLWSHYACKVYLYRLLISSQFPVVHWAMGCGQKNFKLVWRCHQLLSGFIAKDHLPRVSRQSRRLIMIRVIIKWSWGL